MDKKIAQEKIFVCRCHIACLHFLCYNIFPYNVLVLRIPPPREAAKLKYEGIILRLDEKNKPEFNKQTTLPGVKTRVN